MKHALVVLTILSLCAGRTRAQANSVMSQAPTRDWPNALPDSPSPKTAPLPAIKPNMWRNLFHERNDLNGGNETSPHNRVTDKKFWIVTGAEAGSTLVHVLAVNHCRHTVGIENCEGKYGPFRAMQGLNIGFSAGMAAIGYAWKKADDEDGAEHSRWWVIPVGTAAFMGITAIQQYRKHCPAGTHFDVFYCE